jgi:hypothetical protein
MCTEAGNVVETDEDILTFEVPDDALARECCGDYRGARHNDWSLHLLVSLQLTAIVSGTRSELMNGQ